MENRVRYKNKWLKQNTVRQKQRDFNLGKSNKRKADDEKQQLNGEIFCGRRIIEFKVLTENFKCQKCRTDLLLKNIVGEKRRGLHSILSVKCHLCFVITFVPTGTMHESQENTDSSREKCDVNTRAVLGCIHSGTGNTALNKILGCLDIPQVSPNLYKRYERELGLAVEKSAQESCKRAAEEERRLISEKIDELVEEL